MRRRITNAFLAAIVMVTVAFAAFSFSSVSAGTTKSTDVVVVKTCYQGYCIIQTYLDGVLIHEETQIN